MIRRISFLLCWLMFLSACQSTPYCPAYVAQPIPNDSLHALLQAHDALADAGGASEKELLMLHVSLWPMAIVTSA